MDRSLYIAMTGARQVLKAQAANSHNLSNASTTGFRAELQNFASRPVNGPGLASRVYATADSAGIDLRGGQLTLTGRALDVAVDGPGFLAVQRQDGGEGYTRAGNLRVSPGGLLETANGQLVLGDAGPIAVQRQPRRGTGEDGDAGPPVRTAHPDDEGRRRQRRRLDAADVAAITATADGEPI